jgi:hypothetical protein
LRLKCSLAAEEKVYGGEVALKTARHMFNILKEMADLQAPSTDSGIGTDRPFQQLFSSRIL